MITLFCFLTCFVLTGCADKLEPALETGGSQAPTVAAKTIEALPDTGRSIDYEILAAPAVDEPLEIRLLLSGITSAGLIALQPGDGVEIGQAQAQELPIAEGVSQIVVTIVPKAIGRSYLNVILSVDDGAATQTTSLAVPVQVGPVAPRVSSKASAEG